MPKFEPDYRNILDAARNVTPARYPLYEHGFSFFTIEKLVGAPVAGMFETRDAKKLREFFVNHNEFYRKMGYDTVTWELGVTSAMPGNGALGAHQPGAIKCRADFDEYPWGSIEDRYFEMWTPYYQALAETMPEGMRAIGGCGNGVFECVQDVVGYEHLCLIKADDPDLYAELFAASGRVNARIYERFLTEFGDSFAVCRFGDDLGYKGATLLSPADIREHIIPQYRKIVDLVHAAGKPFLLHSCGCLFDVMDDLIEQGGIDAKHSNEDVIAPFSVWLDKYGARIGNFGGIDMDILCQETPDAIRDYTLKVCEYAKDFDGVAFGSGNSIPDYVPLEGYLAMVNTVRQWRGDTVEN